MQITFRAIDRIRLTLLEEVLSEHDLAAEEPRTITPLDLRRKIYEVNKGLQDVPTFYRGDTVPIESTLLDFRGNPPPALATAISVELAVKKLTPVPQQLFLVAGSVVDAALGRVDFSLGPVQTDQADTDEAIGTVRLEVIAGAYTTFEG